MKKLLYTGEVGRALATAAVLHVLPRPLARPLQLVVEHGTADASFQSHRGRRLALHPAPRPIQALVQTKATVIFGLVFELKLLSALL